MPFAPKRPCKQPGCAALVDSGYCEAHQRHAFDGDRFRGSANDRGYTYQWQKFRKAYFKDPKHVMCQMCEIKPATDIHHIKKLSEFKTLKYELSNLQHLCSDCHDSLTRRGM